MDSRQIRQKYLDFFKAKPRNHQEIPAAPLVPPDDPTTLFTSSGMQQLVPYLKGEPHPMGTRLVDSQPSFRAEDIEEVGDNRHTTFFEMLGNWSLGDYFKKEQLPWFFEFLTQEVDLDHKRLYVSVFAGSSAAPKDEESIKIWQQLFASKESAQPESAGFNPKVKIYTYDAKKNWWSRAGMPENMPVGEIGGPDSEVFFDFDPENKLKIHERSDYKKGVCHPNCDCGRFLEIGNSVFMEYIKLDDGSFKPLPAQNVDFGGGLERIVAASQGKQDIFETDLFAEVINAIEKTSGQAYDDGDKPAMRIIADHLRAATFMIAEGLEPNNKAQGYVLRRLLRRAALKMRTLKGEMPQAVVFGDIAASVMKAYQGVYFATQDSRVMIEAVIREEVARFSQTIERGLKVIEKQPLVNIDGVFAFDLLQSYGFPFEITQELVSNRGGKINRKDFEAAFSKHQDLSRTASAGMFKGGLADHSEAITKLHTATHLLNQALRQVLGDHIRQVGSNITAERLRFDFTHPQAVSETELAEVEKNINVKIKEDLPVTKTIVDKDKALRSGALANFMEKYPDKVTVYTVGKDPAKDWFSKELCGGPHVVSTGRIGGVRIKKEEAVGTGKRRIYAVLESV